MNTFYFVAFTYVFYMTIVSIGITFGYHRYFAHRDFRVPAWTEVLILYLGVLCGGRSPLTWVGVHRMHHAYSDTEKDPHCKKYQPWYVILFSLWRVESIPRRFIKDMLINPRVMFFHKYRNFIYVITLLVSFILFGYQSLIVLTSVYLLSYIGFGALNLWGHDNNGPINNVWVNLIAPFEGNHKDHHEA